LKNSTQILSAHLLNRKLAYVRKTAKGSEEAHSAERHAKEGEGMEDGSATSVRRSVCLSLGPARKGIELIDHFFKLFNQINSGLWRKFYFCFLLS